MNEAETLTARAAQHARSRPDQPAVICEDRELSFGTLHRESNRTAHALLAAGLRRGARVGYLGKESEHYYDIALGCAKSGTVLVPINWRLTPVEVDHILRDSGAELLFVEQEFLEVADRLRPALPRLREVVQLDSEAHVAGGLLAWKAGQPDARAGPGHRPGRPGRAAVHQRHHRAAQGRRARPPDVLHVHRGHERGTALDWIDWLPEDRGLMLLHRPAHRRATRWFMQAFDVGVDHGGHAHVHRRRGGPADPRARGHDDLGARRPCCG